MSDWHQFDAPSSLVVTTTDSAVLIGLPKSKLQFWHPLKMVRFSGKSNYRMTISYPSNWTFKCFQPGSGRYNRKKRIAEQAFHGDEILTRFHALPDYGDSESETDPVLKDGVPLLKHPSQNIHPSLDDETAD